MPRCSAVGQAAACQAAPCQYSMLVPSGLSSIKFGSAACTGNLLIKVQYGGKETFYKSFLQALQNDPGPPSMSQACDECNQGQTQI